jgi:hypothetical protein
MSYTTTYRLYRTKVVGINEHRNSWGSAPAVWSYLEDKYLPKQEFSRFGSGMKEVWDLYKDPRLSKWERTALLTTFDWFYCPVELLLDAADDLDQFHAAFQAAYPDRVNHWAAIAADYRTAADKPDHRMLGVCIGCTSVYDLWEEWSPKETKPWSIGEENAD